MQNRMVAPMVQVLGFGMQDLDELSKADGVAISNLRAMRPLVYAGE